MSDTKPLNPDEKRLAELGYSQELHRSWSGFSNFAISFSIISILAGCFTNFGAGFNNGGPISISWSWPILGVFILIIGFTMSELVSAYPTSGGIYWWASKLGGPRAGFFTGWLNLIGLVAVTAGVAYGCATFIDLTISTWSTSYADSYSLTRVFIIFLLVLGLAATANIFSGHLMALMNNTSVWWHVVGAAAIVLILIFVPDHHQSVNYVFTERFNNSGYGDGSTSCFKFVFFIIPIGFLLTQYTITGFDASAHISEETHDSENAAPKGVWRSVFWSAVIGYIVLLAITFAAADPAAVTKGGGGAPAVFLAAMSTGWVKAILIIAVIGQLFCGMSCMTSSSRMMYAFSRDGAVPGWRIWSKVNAKRIPFNAVIAVAVLALILTLPALKGNKDGITVAFTAVVSIGVIGLYIAYVIPIYLRWRMHDKFEPGPWTLGKHYKWLCLVAVAEVFLVVVIGFNLPFSSSGVPWEDDFEWSLFNYTPVVTGGLFAIVGIWWLVSARKTFKGPRTTVEELDREVAV